MIMDKELEELGFSPLTGQLKELNPTVKYFYGSEDAWVAISYDMEISYRVKVTTQRTKEERVLNTYGKALATMNLAELPKEEKAKGINDNELFLLCFSMLEHYWENNWELLTSEQREAMTHDELDTYMGTGYYYLDLFITDEYEEVCHQIQIGKYYGYELHVELKNYQFHSVDLQVRVYDNEEQLNKGDFRDYYSFPFLGIKTIEELKTLINCIGNN